MILLIDAGNTRTKWAWQHDVSAVQSVENTALAQLPQLSSAWLQTLNAASQIWISNVAGLAWRHWLLSQVSGPHLHWVSASPHALGLHNGYAQPAQLGSDRWCAMLAAWQLTQQPLLVASAGSALTIDTVLIQSARENAYFAGGSIQPGLRMMWRSLQSDTAQLQIEFSMDEQSLSLANNTQQAMWQGCLQAMIGALMLRESQCRALSGESPAIVLTGGDAHLMYTALPHSVKRQATVVDDLVIKGLALLATRD